MSEWEVELEPEVRDWYLALDEEFQRRADFRIDQLAEKGSLLGGRILGSLMGSCENCASIWVVDRLGSPIGSLQIAESSC